MRAWMGVAVLAVAGAFGQAEPVAAGHHFVVEMTIAGSQEDAQREQKFEDFASDDTGRIWAAPRDRAQEIAAFRADGKGQLLGVRGIPTGARAWRLMRLPDGWVACLWRDSTAAERYAVTLHRGETTRVWAAFDGKLNEPRMLGCRDGALLITEKGPRVIRLTKGSAAAQSLTLPDALFHMPPKAPGASDERYYSPVCALEDEQQRVWLWSYALDAGNAWRLSALVALRGDEFEKKEIAGIAADARFSAVAVADGESLWLPVVGNRLCKLDLATFRAEPVEVPEPVAFRYVEKNLPGARRDVGRAESAAQRLEQWRGRRGADSGPDFAPSHYLLRSHVSDPRAVAAARRTLGARASRAGLHPAFRLARPPHSRNAAWPFLP